VRAGENQECVDGELRGEIGGSYRHCSVSADLELDDALVAPHGRVALSGILSSRIVGSSSNSTSLSSSLSSSIGRLRDSVYKNASSGTAGCIVQDVVEGSEPDVQGSEQSVHDAIPIVHDAIPMGHDAIPMGNLGTASSSVSSGFGERSSGSSSNISNRSNSSFRCCYGIVGARILQIVFLGYVGIICYYACFSSHLLFAIDAIFLFMVLSIALIHFCFIKTETLAGEVFTGLENQTIIRNRQEPSSPSRSFLLLRTIQPMQ